MLRTDGRPGRVLAYDAQLLEPTGDDWLATRSSHYLKRTLKRLDVTSRSLVALIEPGSCFAGSLLELALAGDRQYMLDGVYEDVDPDADPATIVLGREQRRPAPDGQRPDPAAVPLLRRRRRLEAAERGDRRARSTPQAADELGLVTFAPDDIDLEEEIRIALEERACFARTR